MDYFTIAQLTMSFRELCTMSPEHSHWLSLALKRQRTDLQFLGSDGRKVEGHQSLVSLASPMLAQVIMLGVYEQTMSDKMCFVSSFIQDLYFVPMQVLAEHDDLEQMVTVYLPATYPAIEAFNRFVLIVF